MAKTFLLKPEEVADRLVRLYRQRCRHWLVDSGDWPLRIPLGPPREQDALNDLSGVRDWQQAWQRWTGPGTVIWEQRRWTKIGTQELPIALELQGPDAVATVAGEASAWQQAHSRFTTLCSRWPELAAVLPRHFEALRDYEKLDIHVLADLLGWLQSHPASGLYPRQVPVPGLDSKWIERRRGLLGEALRAVLNVEQANDFYALSGLARPPEMLRLRLLDPALRSACGGLGDLQAPIAEIAAFRLPIERAFIVENLQTGLAFADLPGCVVFMAQGYSVDAFGRLPWLQEIPCCYWGDLDTHGFAILDRLRQHLPHARSLLMDEATLLDHRELWGEEPKPSTATLTHLTDAEAELYEALRSHRYGPRVRLEQERIPWLFAWERLKSAE